MMVEKWTRINRSIKIDNGSAREIYNGEDTYTI